MDEYFALLKDVEEALKDLGACDNPLCEDCPRVLPRVRQALLPSVQLDAKKAYKTIRESLILALSKTYSLEDAFGIHTALDALDSLQQGQGLVQKP
jgi:hypothetical protein